MKKIENFTLFLIIIFSVYCVFINGISFDTPFELRMGNERLKYLFSMGAYNQYDFWNAKYIPGFYSTVSVFITKIFPAKYEINTFYLINLVFSFFTSVGIFKITSELFNKKVGKIVFLICLLNPIFFGHMSINSKDTIVAFSNVWSTYLFLRYLKNQEITEKRNYYVILAGLTVGLGVGTRIVFLGTLVPIFILAILEILFFKKIINSKFSIKKFIIDILKILVIAYLIMVVFWPNAHSNIFTEPFNLFFESLKTQPFGVPWILFNGEYYSTLSPPKSYLIINLLYKTPEFILICYLLLIYLFFTKKNFLKSNFKFIEIKIFCILFILIYPNILLFIIPYKIYDGLRLFLYLIPYLSIIPGLVIYLLIYNFTSPISKIFISIICLFFLYYIFIFVKLTPYHYTYLNLLNGDFSKASTKFENDYWGTSLKELVKKISKNDSLISKDTLKITFCGGTKKQTSILLEQLKNFKFKVVDYYDGDFDYVIMINRSQGYKFNDTIENVRTCFEEIKGVDEITVERNGLILSTLRKKI